MYETFKKSPTESVEKCIRRFRASRLFPIVIHKIEIVQLKRVLRGRRHHVQQDDYLRIEYNANVNYHLVDDCEDDDAWDDDKLES